MLDSTVKIAKKNYLKTVDWRSKILVLFGTRPEAIKLAPVIRELRKNFFQTVVVSSSQHKELLKPFLQMLDVEVDFDLGVMKKNQSPNEVCSRILAKLDKILESEKPDLILVQGDTTTTLAGAQNSRRSRRSRTSFGKFKQPVSRRAEPPPCFKHSVFSFRRDRTKPPRAFSRTRSRRKDFRNRKSGR
jgi:hypothetical protein